MLSSGGAVTDHRHQAARCPIHQRPAAADHPLRLPDEVASDGAAQLQLVAHAQFIRQVGDTSPSSSRSTVSVTRWSSSGGEAIE